MTEKRDKVTVEDIIGLIDCELTDSVEEVRKLRGRNEKRFTNDRWQIYDNGKILSVSETEKLLNKLNEENEQLKQQIKDMSRFEHTGEYIRLSINIETGELQRHIYATGQWFGDFDRVLVTNWLDEKTYQKFIDRVIEVYNTEFNGDVE